jgi:hypothetical protein
MANIWSDETPQQRESRLAMCACMNADVAFRGVRDGLCHFEVYFTDAWIGRVSFFRFLPMASPLRR